MSEEEYKAAKSLIKIADEMYGDLPDGAYWAACDEMGAGIDAQVAVSNYEIDNNIAPEAIEVNDGN